MQLTRKLSANKTKTLKRPLLTILCVKFFEELSDTRQIKYDF